MNDTCATCVRFHRGFCALLEQHVDAEDRACAHHQPRPQPTHYRTSTGAALPSGAGEVEND